MQVGLSGRAIVQAQEEIAVRILAARATVRRDDSRLELAAIRSGHRAAQRGDVVGFFRLVAHQGKEAHCEDGCREEAHKATDDQSAAGVERQVNRPHL